jgi:hypothetical protein
MMKRLATLLALVTLSAAPAFAANALRISQVYGGGGSAAGSTATYNVDYIEIYNSGNVALNIGNYALEYGSAAGNWGSSALNQFVFPVGTIIQPCQYMLVAFGPPSAGGGPLPITADFTGTLTMSATTGKVALFNALNNNLACGAELPGTLIDKVSYGTGNCPEVANVGGLSNNQGAVRNNAGSTDSDNNLNDFTIVGNPVPRNTQSPRNPDCLVTPTKSSTWGMVKSIYR